ncbi:transposase [Bacillus wiedmannii]|uniref:transposase n=1 Tax=Bacillus wiedmannii TaxID=1890302 RepID=UPI0011550193
MIFIICYQIKPQETHCHGLDNARIYHAKSLKPFLRKNSQRLTLIFLPPYPPNLLHLEMIKRKYYL